MSITTQPATVLRYSLQERVVHWLAALSYIYLLLTGLSFFLPQLWWIASFFGGGAVVRFWHPIAGLAFVATVVWMYQKWNRDMRITALDKEWNKAILHYIRNEDENLPPVGRFNTGQKQFFWIMFFGGLTLLISGLVLWFTDSLPWSLRWLRYLAILVHVVAFLTTVAGFIVHVYMGTAVVTGGFASVIRGEVSRSWARTHHRLWLEQQSARPDSQSGTERL
jgi:formate dehydrogenase subunit gamma